MAFSLRLPLALDNEARIRAEQIGVTLNALICFALDQYLRGGGSAAGSPGQVVDSLDLVNPQRLSHRGAPLKARSVDGVAASLRGKLSKVTLDDCRDRGLPQSIAAPSVARKPGKLFSEAESLAIVKSASKPVLTAPVVPSGPPLPPGPGASKAERRAYTDYIRASRKNLGAVTL